MKRPEDLEGAWRRVLEERDALRGEIAAERNKFQLTFDRAPTGVAVIAAESFEYVYVNAAFSDFIGVPVDAIRRSDPYEFASRITHAEDFATVRAQFQRVIDGAVDGYELSKQFIRGDGSLRWGHLTVAASRGPDRRLDHVVLYVTNMDALHRAEDERRTLSDQLAHSQRIEALGRLAGGVAHDLNNRLLVILGSGELIKSGLPFESPLTPLADQVLDSALRSAELTNQLLAFGRREAQRPVRFALNARLESIKPMLRTLVGETIEIATEFAESTDVFCDPGQIEQVIMNLAVNARDAMPGGGRIFLSTADRGEPPTEGPERARRDAYAVLSVRDTGTGIAREHLPRIFEPFFTTKELGQGTGLGLALVDGIVRECGGFVTVDSAPGRGTTFRVFLPRAAVDDAAVAEPASRRILTPVSGAYVLVCDDDDGVRRLLADVVRLRGHAVVTARDGAHALALAASSRVDLLIADVVMPGMRGPELAMRLRERKPSLGVLLISGYADPMTAAEGAALADAMHLAKPFTPGELLETVDALLRRGRMVGARPRSA